MYGNAMERGNTQVIDTGELKKGVAALRFVARRFPSSKRFFAHYLVGNVLVMKS